MMQVPSPSVVTAQDGGNHPPLIPRDETHLLIAHQVSGNLLRPIRLIEPDAFLILPEFDHLVVIGRRHLGDLEAH
jgi:hypothetical protein